MRARRLRDRTRGGVRRARCFPACARTRRRRTCGFALGRRRRRACPRRSTACSIWAAISRTRRACTRGWAASRRRTSSRASATRDVRARVRRRRRRTASSCSAGARRAERISVVGNLAIDGALGEASGAYGDPPSDAARDGIVLFPGSRKHEVANLFAAVRPRRAQPAPHAARRADRVRGLAVRLRRRAARSARARRRAPAGVRRAGRARRRRRSSPAGSAFRCVRAAMRAASRGAPGRRRSRARR